MPAESRKLLETKMSVAAGIMARVQGYRDNGPSCGARSSTRSACASRYGRARQEQRTPQDVDEAEVATRFLEVLAELLRPVCCTAALIISSMALRTEFERPQNVDKRFEGILTGFRSPHLPNWKSRCQHDRGRPEMMLLNRCAPICSDAAA